MDDIIKTNKEEEDSRRAAAKSATADIKQLLAYLKKKEPETTEKDEAWLVYALS